MSAWDAGRRAALNKISGADDTERLAAELLDQLPPIRDDFDRGYRAQLAWEAGRYCNRCRSVHRAPNRWGCCPACLPIEYADGENQSIEDLSRRVEIGDDTALETLIRSDGTEILVFAVGPGRYKATLIPAHEQIGALPSEVRAKIQRARCGRLTRSGKPCRNPSPCRYHH